MKGRIIMTGFRLLIACASLCLLSNAASAAKPQGLLAQWDFDEGKGNIARDSSGNGHDAKVFGGDRVKQGDGYALRLDGRDDYVDCGDSRALGIGGPITIEAWIKPTRQTPDNACLFGEGLSSYLVTYYGKSVYWYVAHRTATNYLQAPTNLHEWSHVAVTFDNDSLEIWINGRRVASRKTAVKTYKPEGRFVIATRGRPDLPHYKGMVDKVRLYNRGLTAEEVVTHFRDEAPAYGFNPAWFKRVKVTPYYYLDRGEIVVEADYKRLQPFDGRARLEVALFRKEDPDKIIQRQVIEEVSARAGVEEVTLPCRELEDGDYIIRVTLADGKGARPVEELTFSYPTKPQPIISPAERTVPALSPKREPTPFKLDMGKGGGFTITLKKGRYPFESRISWPNGDFNRLSAGEKPFTRGEKSWKADVRAIGRNKYAVKAAGDFYTIQREIEVFPTHVYVKDKYTNITDNDLGLLIYNETPVTPGQVMEPFLSGCDKRGRQREGRVPDHSPSVFFKDANAGIGMVPLDDVFVIQAIPYIEWQDAVGVCTEKFALAPGKSYTLEWAVYPTGSGEYYDFINDVRKVEGRIGAVKEAAGFITYGPNNRRQVPTRDFIEKRGINIGIISGLAQAADDPLISIQGIEFMDFPRERELIRNQMAAIHKKLPGFKAVIHIAHSIYTTNRPERFADSRVVNPDGKQVRWGYGYGYIGKERQDEGWRGWIFYPTPGNSFHDALMKSADVVMDKMGCDGVFMDGFFAGYISRWTYDRWDGHSAEIDLGTKTIRRKMGSVLLLSQPSMIAFARKIRDKGGIVIGNNTVFTRSIANEKYIIFDNECASGPQLHLAPSITALRGTSAGALTEKSIYLDMLDKLSWGECFLYYNERIPLSCASLAAKEFPITFEEIRSGLIKGPERIITMNSGVYGWRGKRDLHMVYKFDDRGAPVSHDFITTVDKAGVRTELRFRKNESAVIEPIPVSIETDSPVNARVSRYDGSTLHILLNGRGKTLLRMFVGTTYPDVREGVFVNGSVNPADVGAGTPYRVAVNGTSMTIIDKDGTLYIPLNLNGRVEVVIQPAEKR